MQSPCVCITCRATPCHATPCTSPCSDAYKAYLLATSGLHVPCSSKRRCSKAVLHLQEFSCEICGDVKYRGRREFERHFKEWKHQNGMRALGIPNNKNFYEVTQIAEAKALWENIQVRCGLISCSCGLRHSQA